MILLWRLRSVSMVLYGGPWELCKSDRLVLLVACDFVGGFQWSAVLAKGCERIFRMV